LPVRPWPPTRSSTFTTPFSQDISNWERCEHVQPQSNVATRPAEKGGKGRCHEGERVVSPAERAGKGATLREGACSHLQKRAGKCCHEGGGVFSPPLKKRTP
jgi:hypothetical protein